jgi:hypothetical protein
VEIVASENIPDFTEVDSMNDYPGRKLQIAATHCHVQAHLAHGVLHLFEEWAHGNADMTHIKSELWTASGSVYKSLEKALAMNVCSSLWVP